MRRRGSKQRYSVIAAMTALALIAAACGDSGDADNDDESADDAAEDVATEPDDDDDGSDDEPADDDGDLELPITAVDRGFDPNDWDAVIAAAEGTTVNFHLWGGDESINSYVTESLGGHVQEKYGIDLNLVPLGDTVDGVNAVLNEMQAGRVADGGSVDLIWINGENYFTMDQADALLLDWERDVPNSEYVNWDSEAINLDFGIPVRGQVPWSMSGYQFVYDSDRMDEGELPRTYTELRDWIMDNPGRFTYPAPPEFYGTRFIQYVLFELTGGPDQWLDFDEDTFVEDSRPLWEYLLEIEPHLWEEGETYPTDPSQLNQLFANGEIDFSWTFSQGGIAAEVNEGQLPQSARTYVIENSQGGSANFLGIPANTSNPAGAMVVANASLEPEQQIEKFRPESAAVGMVVEVDRIAAEQQEALEEILGSLQPYTQPLDVLQQHQIPNAGPELLNALDEHWERFIRQGEPLP